MDVFQVALEKYAVFFLKLFLHTALSCVICIRMSSNSVSTSFRVKKLTCMVDILGSYLVATALFHCFLSVWVVCSDDGAKCVALSK